MIPPHPLWVGYPHQTYMNSMMCIMHSPFSCHHGSWVMYPSNPLSNDVYNTKLIVLDDDTLKKCFALTVLETDVNNFSIVPIINFDGRQEVKNVIHMSIDEVKKMLLESRGIALEVLGE